MKLLLEEMTRDEAQEAYAQRAMVVLPTGSIEQHGPHLPLAVDTLAVTHVARGAGALAAQRVPLVVAPAWHYGVSHHHLAFSGTLSLTSHIYIEGLKELVRCLYRHGVRKVFLLNGHGGNQNPNGIVVQALVHEEGLDMAIGSASYWQTAAKALVDAGANDVAPRFPGHAGGFETSVMLALRPDLVQLDKRRAPVDSLEGQAFGTEHGVFQRAGGTSDDAALADAEVGKRLMAAAVQATAETFVTFFERTRRQPVV